MLGDTDAACVAIALATGLKQEKNICRWTKNRTNEDYNTHTQTHTHT